jgi:hypothetical protein
MTAPAVHTTPKLDPAYRVRLERLRLALNRTSGRAALPEWMCANLRSPHDPSLPWSFKDHEYQLGILICEAPYIGVKKSSQVGVSELSAREILGLMTLLDGSHWIYSLQTTTYAGQFATARINPAIEASPQLQRMKHKEVDSTKLKRIGNSFLYLTGAQRTGQAISVPCRGVIRDEIDFCNQTALTSFLSRLTHNEPGTEILQDFSTPTLPDYGIDKVHKSGSQNVYMVYHEKCGQWVEVDPIVDIVLPGFDGDLITLTKAELDDPRVRPDKSYVKCRCCGNEVTRENLMNPVLRAWVPKYPEKATQTFYVSPLCVPKYNTTEKIITAVQNYERADDWINFGLGHAHLPADAAVAQAALDKAKSGLQTLPDASRMLGTALGLDVGKTCHLTVLSEHGGRYVVHWLERIRQQINGDGTDKVSEETLERIDQFGVYKGIVDGGPDVTVPGRLIQGSRYHTMWAAYFARTIKGLENYSLNEVEQIITIARTAMITDMVKDINAGRFIFPKDNPEVELLITHLKKLRRVNRVSETTGETTQAWVSSDTEDHYAFSLLYAYTAIKMMEGQFAAMPALPHGTFVSKAKMPGFAPNKESQIWLPQQMQ